MPAAPRPRPVVPSAAEAALWGIFGCLLVPGVLLATGKEVEVAAFAAGGLAVIVLAAYVALRVWGAKLSDIHEGDGVG
ncbi:hypothetical protein C3Y87_01095 [Carbonactinospora thermoautotrophica]|nr:hypothetical protein [Carbonactinospora thermoautotrophica]